MSGGFMKKITYMVVTKIEERVIKCYIVNIITKQIHSSWYSLVEAQQVCSDLNRMVA